MFKGIEKYLDYISGLGVNVIWIFFIVFNMDNGYYGYWVQNIFEINLYFGIKEDLKFLVIVCYDCDMWVMIDIVINYMGYLFSICDIFLDVFIRFNIFVFFNDLKYFYFVYFYIKWFEECKD